jgi:hypothetical protein
MIPSMITKRSLAAGFLAGLAAIAAWPAAAAEMSLNEMTKAFVFPDKPAAGTTLYGATFYAEPSSQQRATDAPQYSGWCIVAEEGTARYINRSKGPQQRAFRVWYQVTAYSHMADYARAEYLPGRPGKYKAGQKFLDQFPADNSGMPYVKREAAIGDGAIIGEAPYRTLCHTTAGGLNINVDVICRVQIGGWESIGPADIAKTVTTKNYDGEWAEGAALVQRFQRHHARRGEVAEGIARQIVAAWLPYANRKIGPGPDFKGLYLDARQYMFQPKDMPQGFRCTNWSDENFKQVMAQPSMGPSTYYLREANKGTATYAAESLDISIILSGPHFQKPIDHVLADAHDEFTKQPSTAAKTIAQPLTTLRGADEAKMVRLPDDADRRYVVARRCNAVITVQGSLLRGDYTEQTIAMAQRVLDRFMAGDKGRQPEPSGPPRIQLAAEPAALWADGRSTARIRLTCTDASGRGLPGKFTLTATGDGSLRDAELSTAASGTAETVYTAGTRPGTAAVTATSPAGSAKVEITEGGLSIAPEKPEQANLLADGTSAVVLIVRGIGVNGKALAGQAIQVTADESRLPARGVLDPQTVTLAADGTARVTYRAPAISPTTGFRMDNVYVSAAAAARGGAALRSDYRVQVYAGEVAYLVFEKTGFVPGVRWPVALPARNTTVRGKAQARGYSLQQAPLAYATVYAVFGANPAPQPVGKTDAEGNFAVRIVGDPMSSREGEVALPEPIIINLDADFARALTEATEALTALRGRGVTTRGPSLYLYRLPVQVAVANPEAKDLKDTPQGLRNIGMRMTRHVVHVKLIYERQVEDLVWFMQSAEPVVEQLTELLNGMQELEKAAKEKLGEKFDSAVWVKMKKTVVGRVLRTLNAWQKRSTYTLRQWDKKLQDSAEKNAKLREAVGAEEESEEGLPAWGRWLLHWATQPADAALSDAQKATGTDDTAKSVKSAVGNAINSILRDDIEAAMKAHASQLLTQAGQMAERGEVAAEDFAGPAERAKTLFADYQSRHDKVNIDNLNRELYRLDARLFMDTVVKGVYIYVNIKDFAAGGLAAIKSLDREKLAEIQKSVTEGGDKVNTAAKCLDTAFEVYKGKFWLEDMSDAAKVMDEVDKTLLRQGPAAP